MGAKWNDDKKAYTAKAPNTTRYMEHIRRKHHEDEGFGTHVTLKRKPSAYLPLDKRQKTMDDYSSNHLDIVRRRLVAWSLQHSISSRALLSPEFGNIIKSALVDSKYSSRTGRLPLPPPDIFTRGTLALTVFDSSRESKALIMAAIETQVESKGFFSIVSDGCTKKKHHFTSIGVSFIDSSMSMHNYALACIHLARWG